MIYELFFVDQINFWFDDNLCFLKNRFQRIRLNFNRSIFYFNYFLNFIVNFRYFLCIYWNICFRFLLYSCNFLICFISNFLNFLIFVWVYLRNQLFIRRFNRLKRCDDVWAIWINFILTKINLLIKMTIMISKTSWTAECFA